MNYKFQKLLFLIMLLPMLSIGQKEITLTNPSFESQPMHSTVPKGWVNCGDSGESPPDIQPGSFEVKRKSSHGKTYLGLVTRDNDTYESVAQSLSSPMRVGQCYEFSIYLSRSDHYISPSKITLKDENFNGAVRFRVWGGNSPCHRKELLAETAPITSMGWKKYDFKFDVTKGNHRYILLEAFYRKGSFFPYNGNILVDNASSIKECKKDEPLAVITKPKPTPKPTPKPPTTTKPKTTPKPAPKPFKAKVVKELEKPVKEGTVIKLGGERLKFKADSVGVNSSMYSTLDDLVSWMKSKPNIKIEVGGHTNGIPDHDYCDYLSTKRAKSVADYIVKKGISSSRVQYKGYGKREPLASDSTREGRRKNQRVQIKILEVRY